ncbi:MAG: hypothetical protein ABI068_17035 [Ktedonobacterales bacterium]
MEPQRHAQGMPGMPGMPGMQGMQGMPGAPAHYQPPAQQPSPFPAPGMPTYAPAFGVVRATAPVLPPIQGLRSSTRWLALGVGIVSGVLAGGAYYYAGVLPSTPTILLPTASIGVPLVALGVVPCLLLVTAFWTGDGTPQGRVWASFGVLLGLFALQALVFATFVSPLAAVLTIALPALPALVLAPLGFAAGFRWSGATDATDAAITGSIDAVYLPTVARQYHIRAARRHGAQAGRIAAVGAALVPCAVLLVLASISEVQSIVAPPPPPASCGLHSICIPSDVKLAATFLIVTIIASGCCIAVLGTIGAAWLGALLRTR